MKTREPKKTDDTKPRKRNVKKDTPVLIDKALLAFSAARVKVSVLDEDELHDDKQVSTDYLSAMLKRIREAQNALHGARAIVVDLRNTPWSQSMLTHLKEWDTQLDQIWKDIIESLDK